MILNRQRKIRLSEQSLSEFLARILQELKLDGVEVSIAFVTDVEIARWNKKFRQKKGPTDVLSFPTLTRRTLAHFKRKALKGKPGVELGYLGDIAIAPSTAARYAQKNNRSLEDELRVLMLHGVLHLLGYDHDTDHGEMNRIEHDLQRRLKIA